MRNERSEVLNILEKIVEVKRTKLPTDLLDQNIYTPKSFLQKEKFQIIAEIKRGSPSLGLLKPDLNAADTARFYEQHGASAISVLTEEDFFHGSLSDLDDVRKSVQLPLLCKDFIITKEQIIEAKNHGADAILLIVAVLVSRAKLKELLEFAYSIGLSVLVETHNKDEIDIAIEAGSKIIGINNRNLTTFKTNINISLELKKYIPDVMITVSESGIHTSKDAQILKDAGFDALLIGEAFIRNQDFLTEIIK